MDKVLNRGLNFSILPKKLDITQIWVDMKRFERSCIWQEFWYGREDQQETQKPIFKLQKTNLPKNYSIPDGLKTFLGSVRSELQDHKNRNSAQCNLPQNEMDALLKLQTLQKERQIVIRACDKGAGVIILDFDEYLKACYDHLTSEVAPGQPYYSPVNDLEVERTKAKIIEGLEKEIISKTEYEEMNPDETGPGRFYCNFEVHKPHAYKKAPPVRPITSQSGSMCENISTFMEHHIKHIGTKHESYLKDTTAFLNIIENINKGKVLSHNTILFTMDVKGLFTNIPHNEGLMTLEDELEKRENKEVPTNFLIKIMEIILKNNIFEFHDGYFRQNIGATMGSKPVPPYANIFMAPIDEQIKKLDAEEQMSLLKRFLDDYFSIFNGTTKELHALFVKINQIHPTIKFTMSHTSIRNEIPDNRCDCKEQYSIPFLDVSCSLKGGKIVTDLHRKETDRNQYLLPSSCHPRQTTKSIPFSLGLRIVRICSDKEDRDKRLSELRERLLARDYTSEMVNTALAKARAVPRSKALKIGNKPNQTRRPILSIPYDPRLPTMSRIQAKHWRAMVTDSYLKGVFSEPPMTAYRRNQNIRGHLIRAKVARDSRQKRILKGMTKCGKNCSSCPYIKEVKSIIGNNSEWKLNKQLDCNSYNLVYAISCNKDTCNMVYIGETK